MQFAIDGVNFGTPVVLGASGSNGSATSGSTTLTVTGSPHVVTGVYSPTGSFSASSGTLLGGQTVNKATPTFTWTPNPLGPITYGTTLTGLLSASSTTSGSFTYTNGATPVTAATVLDASTTPYTLTATFTPSDANNFVSGGTVTNSLMVNKATLTASIVSNPTKPYDGNATATLTSANFSLSGLVGTDSFTINQTTGTYNSPNVATATTVTASLAAGNFTANGSTLVGNYVMPTTAGGPGHITGRGATWTTNGASKTYGDLDPTPLTTGSGSGFLLADNVTATYTRTAGDTVAGGPYSITATLAPAAALSNYVITNAGASFTITARPATWTTTAASKTYGDLDPSPLTTGSGSGFLAADNVTATYSRVSGETVLGGPYHITATLSPAAVLTNYTVTNTGESFTITPRPATWTTTAASKTYGDLDLSPLTTGSGSGFLAADNVTATYARAAGETVVGSPYSITATLAPAAVLSNYVVTNTGASFTITARPATWTTNAASKTYGDLDPSPLTTGSGSGFLAADNVTATYSRIAGETVLGGPYHITATLIPAAALANYTVTNAGASFTITPRPATWTTTAAGKTYGDLDPSPLTTGSGSGFLAADNVTATYSRIAGETVLGGPYHITATLSPAAVLTNYTVTNSGASFTITARPATWTTTAASKTYGDLDPSPLTTGSGSGFLAADNVTAAYSRVAGETVLGGPYHITAALSPTAVLNNYIVTNAGASFTITARPATWTTTAASKTYGDLDPSPLTTGSGSGFLAADNVTATYTRAAGETVVGSPYSISATLAPAAVLSNYVITNNGASFTITPRPATWTTNAASKTYGDPDPSPLTTGSGSGFLTTDNVTATYTRATGETVVGSPYSITATLAPATVLSNYVITNAGASFTITPRSATWTTNAASKTYGDPDPSPLTTGSGSGFLTTDNVTATYTRTAGETVVGSPYSVTATLAPAAVLSNYVITNNGASFTITQRPATWTTSAASKTYGDLDPSPLTTGSGSGFLAADNVTATYSRIAGETAAGGPYHITATLSPAAVLSNYIVTNVGASFTISPRLATWATTAASKTYGDLDPSPLTTGSGSGFLAADNVTATYSRIAGETVPGGPYHITATLSPAAVLSNYIVTNVGASFTISPRSATWATTATSKTYGDLDPTPLTTGNGSGFLAADNVTATYSRIAGETVLGGPYHITATLSPAAVLSNYTVTNVGASFTIASRLATWATTAASKTYGNLDPSPLTTGSGSGFLAADNVTATYSRAAGETVLGSPYQITATLSPAVVLSNYTVTNVGANFTIAPKALTITASDRLKTLGEAITFAGSEFTSTGLIAGDTISSVSLTSAGAPASALVGTYPIVPSNAIGAALVNYTITYTSGTLKVGYAVCVLYDQSKSVQRNATVPVKLYLCNSTGGDVSAAGTVVTATALALVSNNASALLDDSGNANPDNNFRFDSTLGPAGGYIFNLSTKPLGSGTYGLQFTAGADPTPHSVTFGVR